MERIESLREYREGLVIEARPYQIEFEKALELQPIDLLKDEDVQGRKLLSRADIILIFTLYTGGLDQFLEEYKEYIRNENEEKGYKFVKKPHYYLKSTID